MLIGLGVGIGVLALIAIAAICCYACGKYRSQRTEKYYPNRQTRNLSLKFFPKFGKTSGKHHAQSWVNLWDSNTFKVQAVQSRKEWIVPIIKSYLVKDTCYVWGKNTAKISNFWTFLPKLWLKPGIHRQPSALECIHWVFWPYLRCLH